MKIALACARFQNGDVAFNMAQIRRFMCMAKEQGAQLVCFGEAFLQGFDAYTWRYDEDRRLAVSVADPAFQTLQGWSREIGIDLLLGFLEAEGEKLYSSCALIAEGALHHLYRRISKGWKVYWETDGHYCEGEETSVFTYRGLKCLIALCGDLWEYPERFAKGQDVLFWPVYIDYTPQEWLNGTREEYAEQAQKACGLTLLINPIDDDSSGGGCVFAGGSVQKELPMGSEGLLFTEI